MKKTTTITEALAELKTLDNRIQSAETFLLQYGLRQGSTIDPLSDEGGSEVVIPQRMQSLKDLLERKVAIRSAINAKNAETQVDVCGVVRSVADWIIWRRETFKTELNAYKKFQNKILDARKQCIEKGFQLKDDGSQPTQVTEVASFISETEVQAKIEQLSEIESTLDGKLSLINATTTVEY